MVSPKVALMIFLLVFSCFFFLFASNATSSSSSSSHVNGFENTAIAPQKVNLSVYYDSLCQSCATFIVKNLCEIFNKDLINILNLHLVPWANASINYTNNTILCQNGPDECELNSLEACVLNIINDVGRHKKWESCFSQLGLPKEPILDCYNRGNGTQLGRYYVDETARLFPPHEFLPWVLVNNNPIGKDYANFITYVCKAYNGTSVPTACNLA